jgi:HemY protein
MKTMLSCFIVLCLSIIVGIQLYHDPGYVFIHINQWTIESTVFFMGMLYLLSMILFQMSTHFIHAIVTLPARATYFFHRRQLIKAKKLTQQGLIEYHEGYYAHAVLHLTKALQHHDNPLLNYLTLAKIAQIQNKASERDHYLREAKKTIPKAHIAIELTQANLQMMHQQWEQALATLLHLKDRVPHHPSVLKKLLDVYQHFEDHNAIHALIPILFRKKVISQKEYEQLDTQCALIIFEQLQQTEQKEAILYWIKKQPRYMLTYSPFQIAFTNYLILQNDFALSKKYLKKWLLVTPSAALIKQYARCIQSESELEYIDKYQTLLKPREALYLLKAETFLQLHLYGKAKQMIDLAITHSPDAPEGYLLLARFYDILEKPMDALSAYQAYHQRIDSKDSSK